MKFLIDTSDERNVYLKQLLSKNYTVEDFDINSTNNADIGDKYVLAISTKLQPEKLAEFTEHTTIFGGAQNADILQKLKKKNIIYIDIMKNEKFAVENAKLTAEGILALLIENTKQSIKGLNVLIFGGGRVAISTAIILSKLNINFSIATFNFAEYQHCHQFSEKCFYKKEFEDYLGNFNAIINTIPFEFLDEDNLKKIAPNTTFLEIASTKCLDTKYSTQFKYILCPALPKKYCPQTAGQIIYKLILSST